MELGLLKLRNKALEGHIPSLRSFIALHIDALRAHYDSHDFFSTLEQAEKELIHSDNKPDALVLEWLNKMRRGTRKT